MMQLQQAQERWRSGRARYATFAELGVPAVAVRRPLPSHGGQPVDRQRLRRRRPGHGCPVATTAQCRYMMLAVDSGNVSYRSGETEAAANDTAANRKCWNL